VGLRKWLKVGAVVAIVVVLTIILAPRVYVRYSNAHLVVDGRVTSDFKLYFGPSGRLLLRMGAKQTRQVFVYEPATYAASPEVKACPARAVLFPPFAAVRIAMSCPVANEPYQAWSRDNALLFRTKDGHTYEASWQAPSR
jgi:hypothetical protein